MIDSTRIYLDANATVEPLPEVVDVIVSTMQSGAANPASAHRAGAEARRIVEKARDQVSKLITGVFSEDVVFVSGGTEANNTVLASFKDDADVTFLVAPVEHASVLKPLAQADRDGRVRWLSVDSHGRVDPESVESLAHSAKGRIVLAIQAANSETGVIQPVIDAVQALRGERGDAFVLLDAAQAVGRIPLDIDALDVDAVSFSGHKLHGPPGTGALVLPNADARRISPLILGGGQERGMRSGTLNVPGIAGFGMAALLRQDDFSGSVPRMATMRDAFEARLRERLGNRTSINGGGVARVANTSNVRFAGVDGMRLLALLDERGVLASQGSACSSGRPEPSATLTAMGLSATQAFESIRFSFSILNSIDEALAAADIATDLVRDIAP